MKIKKMIKNPGVNLVENLGAALILTAAWGLIALPIAAQARPIRVSDRATNEIVSVSTQQAQADYNYNQNNQRYFGIAPDGKPIVLDYSNYGSYDNRNTSDVIQPTSVEAQENANWIKVADRVGKSDCLQNIYTGKVLCQEVDGMGNRLVVDRR